MNSRYSSFEVTFLKCLAFALLLSMTQGQDINNNCPALRVPNFGAMSCSRWDGKVTTCTLSCRDGYIPDQYVPSPYICGADGKWSSDYVPDCTFDDPDKGKTKVACNPLNTSTKPCVCTKDFTLQKDMRTCRKDFSVDLITDTTDWYRPTPQQYSVPLSKTLRFRVKSRKSTYVGLAQDGRRYYMLRLDYQVNGKTRVDLIKKRPGTARVMLKEKEVKVLECNQYKPFPVDMATR